MTRARDEDEISNPSATLAIVGMAGRFPGARSPQELWNAVAGSVRSIRTYSEDELRSRGVEFTQPPKKEHWGEHAIFKDSEGNLVLFAKG